MRTTTTILDRDPLNMAAISALPPIEPLDADAAATQQALGEIVDVIDEVSGRVWHLFLVEDGSHSRLLSGESASQGKAEELVTACAIDEFDFEPKFTGCQYIGVIDRDVNVGLQEA